MSSLFVGHRRVQFKAVIFVAVVFVLILTFTASSTRLHERLNTLKQSYGIGAENQDQTPAVPETNTGNGGLSVEQPEETVAKPNPQGGAGKKAKDPCVDQALTDGGVVPHKVKGTKVLVTGGAGFIGSNLVDRLLELGYKVRVFDNLYTGFIRNVPLKDDRVEFMLGDIMDPKTLEKAVEGVEYVYHLAAMSKVVPSLKNPEMARFCVEANALGTWNVLNAVREQGKIKKVVYAASSTYYGNRPPPHQEDMAPDFLTPYAASKYEGELQMQMFDRLFNVSTISTRFFMVYGPRQPSTGAYAIVTGVFAKQAADGKQLTIEGDGSHYRDFIHVQDIVNGLILSQQHPELHGNVVNLGTGTAFSVKDVADLVSKDQKHVPARKNDLEGTLADTCRMKKILGYRAKMDFRKEMSYMVEQTMEGNVFMQDWLTPVHALSAPHLLAPGSPVFKWPKPQNDLGALLTALENLNLQGTVTPEKKNQISVIPLSIGKNDVTVVGDLLLNTIFSLVRFGGVSLYLIAANDETALETCVSLNLPCYDAQQTTQAELLQTLVGKGYNVHYAQLGNSYISPVESFYNSLVKQGEADLYQATPYGDVFVRASAESTTAIQQWSQKNDDVSADLIFTPKKWPASLKLKKSTYTVETLCKGAANTKATATDTTADTTTEDSEAEAIPSEKAKALEDNADPEKSYEEEIETPKDANKLPPTHDTDGKQVTKPKNTQKLPPTHDTDDSPFAEKRAQTPAICNKTRFYGSVGCKLENQSDVAKNAEQIKDGLKAAGLWHLTECADKVHCDVQQSVPFRWVQTSPDLKERGGMC